MFFINVVNYGLISWFVFYLNEVRGIFISEVSYISFLVGFCILIVGVVGGYFISCFFKGKELIIIFVFCVFGVFVVYGVYLFE